MNRGLTLIELIIAIAILSVLFAFSLSGFLSFRNNQALVTSGALVSSVLTKARTNTIASLNDEVYGVHFETDKVELFVGDTYLPGAGTNEETAISRGVSISTITLSGGGSEIVFNKIKGDTSNDGSVIISLDSDASKNLTISVSSTGVIGIE